MGELYKPNALECLFIYVYLPFKWIESTLQNLVFSGEDDDAESNCKNYWIALPNLVKLLFVPSKICSGGLARSRLRHISLRSIFGFGENGDDDVESNCNNYWIARPNLVKLVSVSSKICSGIELH
ncbi:hypothetical protein MA16_Dca018958 [Dendrobium catenatum]|uniref:Uncharacterized protein n=1 Tax=Dendrobium catenatum TaxID=906689 RepID=A0A2I0WNT6_9ASPA|nr:hypothetical protein MA16_Dca018958 [Dendrobium catenatum]